MERDPESFEKHKFKLDRFSVVTFYMLGVALLLPWNAIIASMDFFKGRFLTYEPSFTFLVAVSLPMLLC